MPWVQVTLMIQPHDKQEQRKVTLTRQRINFNPVSSQLCKRVPFAGGAAAGDGAEEEGKLGYIRVATFSKQTTENVKSAIHQLQSEGASR